VAAALVGLVGCANQAAPPGGPQDLRPPVVVRTDPVTSGEMTDVDGRVQFYFDERISESVQSGDLASAVLVSPMTSEVRASHGRSSISVWLEGGFRPGLVYRVTLLPVVSDLFGNTTTQPFEVVFSTGGDEGPTATLAGEVWDRVTGQGVNGAVVQAVGSDSLVHVAVTDRRGVFAFRYLPAGDFVVTGFQDQNRDRQPSARESSGSVPASLAAGDTLVVEIPVLAPDSTPAVPTRALSLDSMTVVVEFDDYLDPNASADQIGVRLTREDGDAPLVTRLMHEQAYGRYVDQVADSFARLDSIDAAAAAATAPQVALPDSATDSLSVTLAPPAATEPARRALPPRLTGAAGPRAPASGRTRPARRIVGLLDGPLQPDVEYQLRVTSVVNINGLPDGGGELTLTYAPPAPPAADTTLQSGDVPADSAAVPDTTDVRP
jgi:hypothetical protein